MAPRSGARHRSAGASLPAVVAALLALAVLGGCGEGDGRRASTSLRGAGSTLVLPLVATWASPYAKVSGGRIDYSPIGSGGGIAAISSRQVDFGASDAPLTPDQQSACHGCVQIPWALSATAVAYHGAGLPPGLRVTGPVLGDIFLGEIRRWDDPRLQALNTGVRLPATAITPVFRSESSGTTYNFTEYLASVSATWRTRVGASTAVRFPVGIGGSKSSGATALLTRTNGSIGYVEVEYAAANHLSVFRVRNAAGRFVAPDLAGVAAAGASVARVPGDNALSIVGAHAASPRAYPISTYSYVIVPLRTPKARELRAFIAWTLAQGQSFGPGLLFSPLPPAVARAARRTLLRIHA